MTLVTIFIMFISGKLSLSERKLFLQTAGGKNLSDTGKLISNIVKGTLIFELFGVVMLSTRFCVDFGFGEGLWISIFLSVAAFCNAGFDILGFLGEFNSLTAYTGDVIVNFTIMFLIIMGGLGFLVWGDCLRNRFKWSKYSLHTKMVLSFTAVLIVSGAGLFMLFEYNHSLKDYNFWVKLLASLFGSVTPRTAGFNTVDMASLSEAGRLLTMFLMFVGGSPGSTAGGVKTTTFLIVVFAVIANIRRRADITIGRRKVEASVLPQTIAIMGIYLSLILVSTLAILAVEPFSMSQVAFEVFSAIGTVGLTVGITSSLTIFSKIVIIILMFIGRIGVLSLAMIFSGKIAPLQLERPTEKIIIG